ncbi:MAG: 23S rRNA (pseudouridine(1915)-N(3))-methyltransferase RlmH, partial [Gammaproteobacteria bacterium]
MRIRLIAVGTRMPAWVQDGFRDYATRMPPECRLELTEIPLGRRGKNTDPLRARMQEGERMLTALDRDCRVIALDVQGRPWDTPKLAERLGDWLQGGRDIALLVGGPDGLSSDCL